MVFVHFRSAGLHDESNRTIPPRALSENGPAAAGCTGSVRFFPLSRLKACD
jgi:hypothetical protein